MITEMIRWLQGNHLLGIDPGIDPYDAQDMIEEYYTGGLDQFIADHS
jgi:hypothetical protein